MTEPRFVIRKSFWDAAEGTKHRVGGYAHTPKAAAKVLFAEMKRDPDGPDGWHVWDQERLQRLDPTQIRSPRIARPTDFRMVG